MPGDLLSIDLPRKTFNVENQNVFPKIRLEEDHENNISQTFHNYFRNSIEMRLKYINGNEKILVPLSGGLDSRYILGTLLELVSPARILTFTFGSKNSYDFEIGKKVAKEIGVKNIAFPLKPLDYSEDSLTQSCLDSDGQINFIVFDQL